MRERTGQELFEEYQKNVEHFSEGKYQGSEEDFLKQYAFYITVIYPVIEGYAEAITGYKIK